MTSIRPTAAWSGTGTSRSAGGATFTTSAPSREACSAAAKAAWPAQFAAALSGGAFEAANDFNIETTDEPVQMLAKYTSRSPRNHSGATDPALDDLYEQLKKALDPAARRQLAAGMFQRLMTGAYVMPLFWDSRTIASSKDLRGWNTTPVPAVDLDLADAWLDR